MDQRKIGRFIAELRTELNLTQTELGDKLGVSYKAVSKWENGICLPDPSLYNDICRIFHITKDELFSGSRKEINFKNKKEFILLILCLIMILTCIFIPTVISNTILMSSIIGIVVIIALGYFTLNIHKLTNISKDNKKLKVVKTLNYFIINLIPVIIIFTSLFKIKMPNEELISIIIILLIMMSGVFFKNFPYNRHIGLRLPWTVRDESTWIIAHKILALISMPLALLTYIATIYFDIEISLTVGIISWILIPSIISGIHFYKLFYKSNR